MQDGPALALPSEPAALALAPCAAAIDEAEYLGAVFGVQLAHLAQAGLGHLVVPRHILLRACRRVAHEGVAQVGRRPVGEVVHLQLAEQLFGLGAVFQYGGHNHHGGILFRHAGLLEAHLEGARRMVEAHQQLPGDVHHHLAHAHQHQHANQHQPSCAHAAEEAEQQQGDRQCGGGDAAHIGACPQFPALGLEQLEAHVAAFRVGFGHHGLHHLVFRLVAAARQLHHALAVVLLRAFAHLAVHARGLGAQGALAPAHALNHLALLHLREHLERVEYVHHQQVVLGALVQFLHVGPAALGGREGVFARSLEVHAQGGQAAQQQHLGHRQQGAHLVVAPIVLAAGLHGAEGAQHALLVGLAVAALQVALHHLLQHGHAAVAHAFPTAAAQCAAQFFLLLADHVEVVEHPLVGASHQPARFGLLHQQEVIVGYLLNTLCQGIVHLVHAAWCLR